MSAEANITIIAIAWYRNVNRMQNGFLYSMLDRPTSLLVNVSGFNYSRFVSASSAFAEN